MNGRTVRGAAGLLTILGVFGMLFVQHVVNRVATFDGHEVAIVLGGLVLGYLLLGGNAKHLADVMRARKGK